METEQRPGAVSMSPETPRIADSSQKPGERPRANVPSAPGSTQAGPHPHLRLPAPRTGTECTLAVLSLLACVQFLTAATGHKQKGQRPRAPHCWECIPIFPGPSHVQASAETWPPAQRGLSKVVPINPFILPYFSSRHLLLYTVGMNMLLSHSVEHFLSTLPEDCRSAHTRLRREPQTQAFRVGVASLLPTLPSFLPLSFAFILFYSSP